MLMTFKLKKIKGKPGKVTRSSLFGSRRRSLFWLWLLLTGCLLLHGSANIASDVEEKAAFSGGEKSALTTAGENGSQEQEVWCRDAAEKKQSAGESLLCEDSEVFLWRQSETAEQRLTVGQYLVGVVAAEMPVSYPLAALEAQAVVARTYLYAHQQGEKLIASDDYQSFQAYISVPEMQQRWGEQQFAAYYQKVARAVANTAEQVVVYKGQLIDPVYHASCGGQTENSEDVWSAKVAYLRSVYCPEAAVVASLPTAAGTADTAAPSGYARYAVPVEKNSFSLAEFDQKLGTSMAQAAVEALTGTEPLTAAADLLTITEQSAAGKIISLSIAGDALAASEVRRKLGLKSTEFSWRIADNLIEITTVGYGHGVGLCQHGAGLMAEEGCNWREIVQHFYSGVEFTCISP